MKRPETAIRFATTRGGRYSIALFESKDIIVYTHERKTAFYHDYDRWDANDRFDRTIRLAKEIDNINFIEDIIED